MITRNLHNYFISHISGVNPTVTKRSGATTTITIRNYPINNGLSTSLTANDSVGYSARSIRIGEGATEPSIDDYELERVIEVAPKNITSSQSGDYQNNYDIVTATFLNETDSDWTVTEVGQYMSTSTSDASAAILLAREVFDPVTVKPGQTFSVSMKLF